jgi:hypothetical protein
MPKFKISATPINLNNSLPAINASYSRKALAWSFEQEKRIIAQLNNIYDDGNYYVSIPDSAIKEIYLGLNFELTGMACNLISSFHSSGGKIHKMTKSRTEYTLIPIGIDKIEDVK